MNQTLPHDIDAERAMLAVLLLDPGRVAEVTAVLKPADFEDELHRSLFVSVKHQVRH